MIDDHPVANREVGASRQSAENRVANLWTKFMAFDRYAMVPNVKDCKNPIKTQWLQLSITQKLTFLHPLKFGTVRSVVRIHSPRPFIFNNLRPPALAACFLVVADLW
jgi:hypothetical protein